VNVEGIGAAGGRPFTFSVIRDYLEVIKPRETGLLVLIGVVTSLVAAGGAVSGGRILFILVAILIASAGANGLTNYLDRSLDARMERTRRRAIPSGRIFPAHKALIFCLLLSAAGLALAWLLHPLAFLADVVGTLSAVLYRKRVTCVFPQGMIASCAPVLMGWFAVGPSLTRETLLLCVLLCILIAVWLPSHIWSIMLAHREDYRSAGINYFPLNSSTGTVSIMLVVFCLLLFGASLGVYFAGNFGLLYLVVAVAAGLVALFASIRLMLSKNSQDAWKLYKLSAFPYLGLVFLAMAIDILL